MAQRDFRSICSHSWMTTSNECKPVTWFHWENVKAGSLTRLARVEKQSTSEGLVEALQKDLQTFSYHLFSARWQWEQYKNISTDVHENTIVFCMDFGENYSCCPQDASQGCHWTNTKCTTHPIVASYTCNKCEVEEGRARPTMTVTASVIIISSDLQLTNIQFSISLGRLSSCSSRKDCTHSVQEQDQLCRLLLCTI